MPLAIQTFDNFGVWDILGIVTPIYEQFTEFPDYTEAKSKTTKLLFGGNIEDANSYGYIRVRYWLGGDEYFGQWVRIYPSAERQIIEYPHPEDFGFSKENPQRYYQVMKRHYKRYVLGTNPDTKWSLRIQVCNELASAFPTQEEQEALILGFI